MYQFRSPTGLVFGKTARSIAITLLGSAAALSVAAPSYAAPAQTPQVRQEITQTRLSSMRGAELSRIDWRQPEMKLKFDLTESDWIDGIDLILSMNPSGQVSRRGPILVSLNNSAPLKMNPYGQSFDARLRFDESFVRAKGNVITIRVPVPDGGTCLTTEHGGWNVNVKKSSIVVRTRAKSRNFFLREVADRLQNPTSTPKTVSILAKGNQKTRLEMLAAQGIALQTPDIPNFKTTAGRSDMDVIIARRDELSTRVSDKDILSDTGPKISVHKGRPMRLVITGDTDAEVLSAAQSFASYHLPAVRRRHASSGEVGFQVPFADKHIALSGKTRFGDLNQTVRAMNMSGTPNTLTFNVADPSVTSGNVLLRLSKGKTLSENSKVEVELNGQSIGFTTLDRRRKSVNFAIPEGALHGSGNTLKIIPALEKKPSVETFGQACPSINDEPGLFIGDGSRIELSTNGTSPFSELSRLTADGSLFANAAGANTHIVLTAKGQNDIGASLELLAKLARTSGTGWTNATISRNAADSGSKNILVIGPNPARTGLLDAAPRSLGAALKGKSSTGSMVRNFGDYEKFASADAAKTLQMYAAKTRAKSRIGSGGVAAIFPDGPRLIGVVSSTPGRSFASVTQDLLEGDQWNNLSGSVSRWNSKTVLMAQTALPTPQLNLPSTTNDVLPRFELAWLEDSLQDGLVKLADLGDMASEKFADIRSGVEIRLVETLPADTGRSKIAELSRPAPAGVPQPSKAASLNAAEPLYKTASAATQRPSLQAVLSEKLVAPLRGFSSPKAMEKVDSRTPQWIKNLLAKVQKETSADTPAAVPSASAAPSIAAIENTQLVESNPIMQMLQRGDSKNSFLGILMGLSLLMLVLMLGLIKPKPKKRPIDRFK